MIKYLGLMQQLCLLVKANNIYRPRSDSTDLPEAWLNAASDDKGTCPASDECLLYQYCAAGRAYGMVEGSYGPPTVKLLDAPNIVPWTSEQLLEIAAIINDYAFPDTMEADDDVDRIAQKSKIEESNMYRYNLGSYRYSKGKIYKKLWWFIYKCIDKGPYKYLDGVKKVNKLAKGKQL